MIAIRRHLHQQPEISFQEAATSQYIADFYQTLDCTVSRVGDGFGLVVDINPDKPGKKLAIRADFDALAVVEDNELPFKSQNKGVMHACGHDAHTAYLMVLARELIKIKDDIPGAIKDIIPGGADVSFEVAGVQPTFEQAIDATRPRGTMVIVSIFAKPISFDPMQLMNAGVKLTTTIAYSKETFQQTVDLVSQGQIDVAPVITDMISLDNIVTDGFESLTKDKSQAKILVNLKDEA
ncbi:M20/M25/M40 family metallo-hydrolase [Leuconostoc lactis]|uniref:M20/M25/M40 family metallo-hydrolase n=1 Tax=Leuconostoc lactis TaxID=1246 RepID=UPI00263F8191|nr:M20/M25/M40 family metallo-hydrolase [Leuconostoc lactis]